MRVMTYNLKGLHMSARAAATVVRPPAPDVLAVQEPPRGPFGRRRMRRFGSAVGLVPVVSGHGARTTALLVAGRAACPARTRGPAARGGPARPAAGCRSRWSTGSRSSSSTSRWSVIERAAHLDRLLRDRRPDRPDGGARRPQRAARRPGVGAARGAPGRAGGADRPDVPVDRARGSGSTRSWRRPTSSSRAPACPTARRSRRAATTGRSSSTCTDSGRPARALPD